MKNKDLKPTLILENDDWFWKGTEEFLAKFGEFCVFSPKIREQFFVKTDTMDFCMILSQPVIERIVVVSAFENTVPVDNPDAEDDDFLGVYKQIEYFCSFIRQIIQFREWVNHKPLEFHIVYNGHEFLEDLHAGRLGKTTLGNLYLIARQQPELFKVSVYRNDRDKFEFLYHLDQVNLEPRG